MSDLSKALKALKYDKRMLSWNLRQKIISQKEYQKHLSQLKDMSHLAASDSSKESKEDQNNS